MTLRFPKALIALLLFPGSVSTAQPQVPDAVAPALTRAQVQKDVALAIAVLREVHPELYRYRSKGQVDAALVAADDRARDPAGVFLGLLQAVSSIRDHHIMIEPGSLAARQIPDRIYLPFAIRFVEARLYVVRPNQVAPGALSPSGRADPEAPLGLRPGDEIVSIDGKKSSQILRRLASLVSSDGETSGYQVAALNSSPNYPAGSAFYAYLPYVFPDITRDGSVVLTIKRRGARAQQRVAVDLIDREAWLARVGTPLGRPIAIDKVWALDFEDDVAVLRAGSFLIQGKAAEASVRNVLQTTLLQLNQRKPRRLVIDIRNNGGGQDTGIDLLRGFAKSAFTYQQPSIFNRLSLSQELKPYVRTYQGPVPDLPEADFTRLADGRWAADPRTTPRSHTLQEPFPGAYTGDVVILVDGGVGSAGTMFAAKAQSLGRARIIGEPTGGSRLGPTAGTVLFVTLPNSGVVLTVPVIRQVMNAPLPGPDGGVVPDELVRTTIDDVLAGRDRAMEVALRQR